jgi:hypothetical protein
MSCSQQEGKLILAKERALPYRFLNDVSMLPLHDSTWCLVLDPRTKSSEFELLKACQDKSMSGSAVYHHIDRGLGIHPEADRDMLNHLIRQKKKLTATDYELFSVATRMVGQRDHITVILVIQDPTMKKTLANMRRKHGQDSSTPIRWPFSRFKKVGDKDGVFKLLKQTDEGQRVLERRARRVSEKNRRADCKRHLHRAGRSRCEAEALKNGISFGDSDVVYTIREAYKSSSNISTRPVLCCGRVLSSLMAD